MPKKSRKAPVKYVPHARYGSTPQSSGVKIPEAEIRKGFWRLRREIIFPETVLVAETQRQNFAVFPRKYYVDVLKSCNNCRRAFIFFAREQKYWFETLYFFVDADCVLCPDCRRKTRTIQRRLRRYSDLFAKKDTTHKELMFLVDDASFLLRHGVLKNLNNIGSVKNRAKKEIPEYDGIAALAEAIDIVRQAQSAA